MQTILVPVDMSPTSAAALGFATYLALSLDMGLRIVHVFDPLEEAAHTLFADERSDEKRRLERELDGFCRRATEPVLAAFRERTRIPPALRTEVVEGLPAATITGLSQREEYALIVMGGVGTGAGTRPPGIFGSVARNVATHSVAPVVLLPATFRFAAVERIAVALERPEELREKDAFLQKLVGDLHCEVRYVHVREAEAEPAWVEEGRIDLLPPGRVVPSLLAYARESRIDLLVLTRRKRSFFAQLFHDDHLGPLVRRSKVPVLVMPPRETVHGIKEVAEGADEDHP